jgi:2-iminobutanoate/2-iminopropanoate deaminase
VRCYLSKKKDWAAHNRIYREFFKEPFPARTTLIGCLGNMVKYEVDLIAYAGKKKRKPAKSRRRKNKA